MAIMVENASLDCSPSPLLSVLSIPVIFDSIIPHLPLQSLTRLSKTSKSFREFIFTTPKVFRYLDASRCRGAYIPPTLTPIDSGGNTWRSERMDENLTEDEFYAGPLRGVLAKLGRKKVLQDVHVMVLDGLASVTADLVMDIATNPEYSVRIMSMRNCDNLHHTRLRQFLQFICRPNRPENTPRLQGLYLFSEVTHDGPSSHSEFSATGMTVSDGATLGVLPVDKSRNLALKTNPWYAPSGRIIRRGASTRSSWEETMSICRGIIAFDAVLCSHMHSAMADCLHEASKDELSNKPGIPTIATVALGPEGCSGCGRAPDGAPVWGESNVFEFPLLWPPPYSGRIADAVRPPSQRPSPLSSHSDDRQQQRLIVSCTWCLANRHCDSCHRWWCSDCYNPKKTKKLSDLEALSNAGMSYLPSREELTYNTIGSSAGGDSVKVFNGLCVENCLVGEMMSGAGSFGMWA